jgi:malate permease and related proteins
MQLLSIFANNILPILLLSGAGFALGKTFQLDPRPLGRIVFYILSPILVFDLLTSNALPLDRIAIMMGFSALSMIIVAMIAFLLGKLFRLERTALIAVVITAFFTNGGNYGLPLVSFAFGQAALAYASVYFVTSSVLFYTVGVVIASLGHLQVKVALAGLLKVPAIYAIILAMIFIQTGWTLPEPIQRTVILAAGGTVPSMLVLLGLELQRAEWNRNFKALSIPVFCRLILGPIVGLGIAALFGLHGPARQAGITESSTPAAVMNTVLATEYKLDASLVTAIIFISTVLSPLTLTPVLYFLGR